MPVPFGISIGDFIALIETFVTVVNSLKDSTGAAKEYGDVILELDSLKLALTYVQTIETNETEFKAALHGVVANCRHTIQGFLNKIDKYDVSLGSSGASRRKIRNGLRKVQWALYSQDDIRKFHMQVLAHTASLNLILLKVGHRTVTAAHEDCHSTLKDQSRTLVRIESELNDERERGAAMQVMIISTILSCWADLRSFVAAILFSNLNIFNRIAGYAQMPTQVLQEEPITFEDAHGRILPIHTVWIDCWDHFETMLKWKFSSVPGLNKIEKGEYILADTFSRKDIRKDLPIQAVFRPGRYINMSMTFLMSTDTQRCPKCELTVLELKDRENHCQNCGLRYDRRKRADRYITAEHKPIAERRSSPQSERPRFFDAGKPSKTEVVSDFGRVRIIELDDNSDKIFDDSEASQSILSYRACRHVVKRTHGVIEVVHGAMIKAVKAAEEATLQSSTPSNAAPEGPRSAPWPDTFSKTMGTNDHRESREIRANIPTRPAPAPERAFIRGFNQLERPGNQSYKSPLYLQRATTVGANKTIEIHIAYEDVLDKSENLNSPSNFREFGVSNLNDGQQSPPDQVEGPIREVQDKEDERPFNPPLEWRRRASLPPAVNKPWHSNTSRNLLRFKKIEQVNSEALHGLPVYPRIHKTYLSEDTLTYYNLPYECDKNDPEYMIILREIDRRETDILFEHTRRARQPERSDNNVPNFVTSQT